MMMFSKARGSHTSISISFKNTSIPVELSHPVVVSWKSYETTLGIFLLAKIPSHKWELAVVTIC